MTTDDLREANEDNKAAWDANASYWDVRMQEGNDFVNVLEWPAVERLLDPQPGQRVLDIATGNGLTARRLAERGAAVQAFDFSSELIALAKQKTNPGGRIAYSILDATDEAAMYATLQPAGPFDSALCNMGLFDIAELEPLFHVLPRLLKKGGAFVFSLTHPAFNNASGAHVAEETDEGDQIRTVYSVKITRYMTPYHAYGRAMREQPKPQIYFERPLQFYLNLGFRNGFVLDGFEERAFPPEHPQTNPLAWGGKFSEIPPVLVARLRLG